MPAITLGAALAVPIGTHAACQIEYSDGLVQALSRATGQYVAKYHGNFSSLAECEAVRRDAIAQSGDPSLALNMTCTGCSAPAQGQSGASGPVPNAAAEAAKKKFAAQQKAEQQAAQQQFFHDKQTLSQELKGVTPASGSGLVLKQAPAAGSARQQLDCILTDSQKSETDPSRPPGGDWQNLRDCAPQAPAVPPVPEPKPVSRPAMPADAAAAKEFLATLARQITETRQQLTRQDQAITRLEQEVAREEASQPLTGFKEAPRESEALRRAREALTQARAARQRLAEELQRMEAQKKSAPHEE
ncbi:hypothetical protein [Sulfurivermis fontis]|uniref:hypothetical protein n=1 Tax=Sulfurivermis fontis TaxID=1972068 RepID=UPI000FD7999D|nr:hypothetical protein [Sulfurivermis fontis]